MSDIFTKKIQLCVYQFIFYNYLVFTIPPQNMFKICPHIAVVENKDFSKADMGVLHPKIFLIYANIFQEYKM